MPDFDPDKLTIADRRKIEKRARRNVVSEVKLILSAGFALLMIVSFWLGQITFLPLAELLQIRPTLAWIGLSASISVAFSLVHSWLATRKIARAREQQFIIRQHYEAERRAETERRITGLR